MLDTLIPPNADFIAMTAVILAVPGPTNALLAASGAAHGLRRSLKLVPTVLIAYLAAILAWGILLTPAIAWWPPIGPLMRLACALFLAVTAVRLWRGTTRLSAKPAPSVNTHAITLITLLNPKAVLFATGGFPPTAFTQPDVFYAMAVAFAIPQLPIALAWIGIGAAFGGADGRISTPTIHRIAAVLLAFFSASIGASVLI